MLRQALLTFLLFALLAPAFGADTPQPGSAFLSKEMDTVDSATPEYLPDAPGYTRMAGPQ